MITATTSESTCHGNPGQALILWKGKRVEIRPASNLPEDSPIKWWAHPLPNYPWTPGIARWAEGPGVGLHADDVIRIEGEPTMAENRRDTIQKELDSLHVDLETFVRDCCMTGDLNSDNLIYPNSDDGKTTLGEVLDKMLQLRKEQPTTE